MTTEATPPTETSETAKPAESAEQTSEEKQAAAVSEAARLRDQLLRTAADFDNFRKRSRREIEDAQRRGREGTVKDLLPVFDNLERAAGSADHASDAKAVADGLRMVLKQFVDTLDRMGIKRIAAVGKPFDPSVHEAISHVDSNEPAGMIVTEVQPGYSIGDFLVRASLVVVSKGPAEAPADAPAS
jgi:molecular chaperone GrpE